MLVPEKSVAAFRLFGLCDDIDNLEIVSGLGMAKREYRAARRLFQNPCLGFVTFAPQIGRDTGRDEMHVHAERGRRGSPRQPALLAANLRERQPEAAELLGNGRNQVP